ncbi:MAG: hypothetical protein IJG68_00130 [Bacilli bacterium]|nr:hypothetical protein [Bacilli bacterium]
MNLEEEYNSIKTPEELLEFMNQYIHYGIFGTDHKEYTEWNEDSNSSFQEACRKYFTLCDKNRILKHGLGICWDQVELERTWFEENHYKTKTFFIWFYYPNEDNSFITHTYLVYQDHNKYYYFEHSDEKNKGIYSFNTLKDAIKYQMEKHISFHKDLGYSITEEELNHIEIREFERPNYPCDNEAYMNHILESNIIYTYKDLK